MSNNNNFLCFLAMAIAFAAMFAYRSLVSQVIESETQARKDMIIMMRQCGRLD